MTTKDTLYPGSTLGLMGGGQLGRMFAQAAASMGYHVAVLEPGASAPAAEVALQQISTPYDDAEGIAQLARQVRAVTTEFENVPAASLDALAAAGVRTTPSAKSVAATQNRNTEKAFIERAGVPVAPHRAVRSEADAESLPEDLFPGILKTASLGYDGKGQARVANRREALDAFRRFGGVECVLEKRLSLALEVSVIVCRDLNGNTATFPVSENVHRDGILAVSVLPARIDQQTARRAREYAVKIAEALDYHGVLCVEQFILADGSLLVNELAPRPHNSGHATIDACMTSQYEQQVRIMAGLPLGSTEQHSAAVMLNLLGDLWLTPDNMLTTPDWSKLLAIPGVKLHLYGKAEARRARKMGHVTIIAADPETAMQHARKAACILGLPEPV